MEFLGSLGIDSKLLFAQIVNFGLLLWILNRFLYKPVIKQIEKDEDEMNKVRIQKEDLAEEKRIFVEKKENETKKIKKEAKEIIKKAEEIAFEIKEQVKKETQEEKKEVINQIKARLD